MAPVTTENTYANTEEPTYISKTCDSNVSTISNSTNHDINGHMIKFKSFPLLNGPSLPPSRYSQTLLPLNPNFQRRSISGMFHDYSGNDKIGWEFKEVTLNRVGRLGFGIAVSGGRDNPHFPSGDPSIAISDVLKSGPAEGKLLVNDRVISANGISLECVDYSTAVQVLRECGNAVNLVIKRRVIFPSHDLFKVTLTKSKRKDDFGVVLGCRLFVKEITNRGLLDKDCNISEGDIVLKINNTSTENLSLKDAKKLIDGSKEKLHLVLRKESSNPSNENGLVHGAINGKDMHSDINRNWSNQNVYVQPPTRGDFNRHMTSSDEKANINRGQLIHNQRMDVAHHRAPISEISLSQLDQPATPLLASGREEAPPRPPIPRLEEVRRSNEPRLVSFKKEGSLGLRLTGGNEVGIFISGIQHGSAAALQGLKVGDKVLKVNSMDLRGTTKEEAVVYMLSVENDIDFVVQYCKEEYDEIVSGGKGDSFYIRTHFKYDSDVKGELNFGSGEIFHVIDTLYNGVVGSWLVYRLCRKSEIQKGVIPNSARAQEIASEQIAEKAKKEENASRGGFFRRRSARRSKSLVKERWEDIVFSDNGANFPAYERVTLKHPGFIRPIVLFGPLSDIARDKLLRDYPDKYASPIAEEDQSEGKPKSGIVRLSAIREIIDKGKHALLDVSPGAVDRLNYAQFSPIVIFLRAENKSIVKELRARYAKPSSNQKSSRKLYEKSVKLEKMWSHVFTSVITLGSAEMWYKKLRETIEKQQQISVWVPESKPEKLLGDDFLFPMTSRLSYASSPESDLDLATDCKREEGPRLMKASSDPSIATVEEIQSFGPPPYNIRQESNKIVNKSYNEKTDLERDEYFDSMKDPYNIYPSDRYPLTNSVKNIYGINGPEPPPRIDRGNKPNRFRTAHERLFGRCDNKENGPDYINTTSPNKNVLERPTARFMDNSSFSSESYKYGSPSSTLDDRRYGSLTSANSTAIRNGNHETYKFNRPGPGKSTPDRNKSSNSSFNGECKPIPPSPPPKPSNYQSVRVAENRPIPPPKPMYYGGRIWPCEIENNVNGNTYVKRMDLSGGPPGYFPPTKDVPPNTRAPAVPSHDVPTIPFINNSSMGSPTRRPPYSDTDSSSGYMTGKSSYEGRSPYSYKTSSRTSIINPNPGPYLNIPYRRQTNSTQIQPSTPLIDLSSNRESRGSAFELYRKPGEPVNRDGFTFHGLSSTVEHENKEESITSDSSNTVYTAKGMFTNSGGALECNETGVKLIIPPGAITSNVAQEVFFKVCKDNTMLPQLDQEKDETFVSPIVMCGPPGLVFDIPVELRLPHSASVNPDTWSFALKAKDTNNGQTSKWQNVTYDNKEGISASSIDKNYVSVLVDHF